MVGDSGLIGATTQYVLSNSDHEGSGDTAVVAVAVPRQVPQHVTERASELLGVRRLVVAVNSSASASPPRKRGEVLDSTLRNCRCVAQHTVHCSNV